MQKLHSILSLSSNLFIIFEGSLIINCEHLLGHELFFFNQLLMQFSQKKAKVKIEIKARAIKKGLVGDEPIGIFCKHCGQKIRARYLILELLFPEIVVELSSV